MGYSVWEAISAAIFTPTPPEGIKPVKFDANKYLGRWYELARYEHAHERGLTNINANYGLHEDGGLVVTNRGFDPEKKEWREKQARAYFTGPRDEAALKVCFFWPFWGGYFAFYIDKDYRYAVVSGPGPERKFLWILSRDPHPPKEDVDLLLQKATEGGYTPDKLIWTKHEDVE